MARVPLFTILSFLGVFCSTPVAANNHGVTFQWPIGGLTVNYLDVVNVTYHSSFPTPKLLTFCYNQSDPTTVLAMLQQNVTPYSSSELVIISWPQLSSCHFDLRPNNTGGNGANSPSIAINNTARATPITLGISQPTSVYTSTSTPTNVPVSSASSDASTSSSPAPSNKSLSGSWVGIGIGVSVGVAVISFAALGFWFMRRRKRVASRGMTVLDHDSHNNMAKGNGPRDQKWAPAEMGYGGGEGIHMQPVGGRGVGGTIKLQPQEMPAETRYEMPADTGHMR